MGQHGLLGNVFDGAKWLDGQHGRWGKVACWAIWLTEQSGLCVQLPTKAKCLKRQRYWCRKLLVEQYNWISEPAVNVQSMHRVAMYKAVCTKLLHK